MIVGKPSMKSSALTEHLRIHTKEKHYHCKKYKKSFRHNSGLVEYLKIHPGENLMNVMNVGRLSLRIQASNDTRKFIIKFRI